MPPSDEPIEKTLDKEPALEIDAGDLPHNSSRSTYLVYHQGNDQPKKMVASARTAAKAFEKALSKGYKRSNLSISFNNQDDRACFF